MGYPSLIVPGGGGTSVAEAVEKLRKEQFGDIKAQSADFASIPKICGIPDVLYADAAPSADVVPFNWDETTMGRWGGSPYHLGQRYININGGKIYEASDTASVSSWRLLN